MMAFFPLYKWLSKSRKSHDRLAGMCENTSSLVLVKGSQCCKDTPNTAGGSTPSASRAHPAPPCQLHAFQVLMNSNKMTCSRQRRQRESALVGFVKLLSKPLLCMFNRGETIAVAGCASDLTSFDNVHWQFQKGPAAEEHPEIGYRRHSNGTSFQHTYIKGKSS